MSNLSKVLLKCFSITTRPSFMTPGFPKEAYVKIPSHREALRINPFQYNLSIAVPQTSSKVSQIYLDTFEVDIPNALSFQLQKKLARKDDLSKLKGLPNFGNTCFIASVVQASLLFQKSAFEKKLITASENEKRIILAILHFIHSYESSNGVASLSSLLPVLRENGVYNGAQEDAAEFLTWIGNFLPESPVFFQQIAKTAPLNAGESVIAEEENRSTCVREIPLEVENVSRQIKPGQTLLGLLNKFFAEVDVSDQNAYLDRIVMSIGGGISERKIPLISRKEIMSAAPLELTFQIKKFQCDRLTGITSRLGGSLSDVPETFEMPVEYCANGEKATYRLRSVIYHHGNTPDSGHYTAYVRKGETYFCANDSTITEIDRQTMLKAAREGYILIYDKVVPQ